MDRTVLERKALTELKQIAAALELKGYQRMKKADLVDLIIGAAEERANGDAGSANGDADADADAESRERARPRARRQGGEQPSTEQTADGDRAQDDGGTAERNGSDGPEGRDGGDGGKRERRRKNRGGQGGPEDLEDAEVREGVLDLLPEGYGFLRVTGYLSGERDVYVSQSFVRRHNLRRGDRVAGPIRRNKSNDKFPALARVDAVEGVAFADIDPQARRPEFDRFAVRPPSQPLRLGDVDGATADVRLLDLVAPIGRGQRGVIAGPPASGKSTLLRSLASAARAADGDAAVVVVLVDARPEDAGDLADLDGVEVVVSEFDRPVEDHTQVAELALERAKRLAERGQDVVVLLDSLTRLARAYQVAATSGNRAPSTGTLDATALYPVKRLLAAARPLEGGGSVTLLATATTGTRSEVDDLLLEELADAVNLEARLDAELARRRVWPAIDVTASLTRRAELLAAEEDLELGTELRRALLDADTSATPQVVAEAAAAAGSGTDLRAALRELR